MSNEVEHRSDTKEATPLTTFQFHNFEVDQSKCQSYSITFKPAALEVVSADSSVTTSSNLTDTTDESNKKRTRVDFESRSNTKETFNVMESASRPLSQSKGVFEKSLKSDPICVVDKNPEIYVKSVLESHLGFHLMIRPTLKLSSQLQPSVTSQSTFFPPITEDCLNGYDMDIVSAVRDEDISTLRALHSTGRTMSCSNRFGESLLHMACRRGFTSIVKFLVEEAGVAIRITDDCGRTPLHDALWNRDCQFEIFDVLVNIDPALLLVSDKRGHTPFAYARKEKWETWINHIKGMKGDLVDSLDLNTMELFRARNVT